MIEKLEDRGLDDEAADLEEVYLIDNGDMTFTAPPTSWASIIGGLRVMKDDEGVRSNYLRKKLARRLNNTAADLN